LRIISGYYKGRKIALPSHIHIRPTTDFAKESLFNIINNKIDFNDIVVLDLFAGTGSISYEFISRGVKELICVENNFKCIDFIKTNISLLNIDNMKLVRMSVHEFLKICTRKFDIIFADPPYDMANMRLFVEKIKTYDLLSPEGFFILEHSDAYNFSDFDGFTEHRHYGSVNFSFFSFK